LRPLVVARVHRTNKGVEAIPFAALALVSELGLDNVLKEAGATLAHNFENQWGSEGPRVQNGHWIHVERSRLAAAAIREAVKRGSLFRVTETYPEFHQDPQRVRILINGEYLEFQAAIDATGRTAVQSRPIRRAGSQVADLYDVSHGTGVLPTKILRLPFGWAYSMATQDMGSIAVLSDDGKNRPIPFGDIERGFSISQQSLRYVGRRPAFVQWSENPVNGRVIAVGDAALAYDPLAGQGIRFALSSAITASSVIKTWSKGAPRSTGEQFYRSFVTRSRDAHLRFLEYWRAGSGAPEQQKGVALPKSLVFSDEIAVTELHWNDEIHAGVAFRLANGDFARWVGGSDLIEMRNSTPKPISSEDMLTRLQGTSGDGVKARHLLEWCLQNEILRSAT